MLDVGCGPGTITKDIANKVGITGKVVGLDRVKNVIDLASNETKAFENLSFETGNVYQLPFEDNSFDLVHAHMVLQHLVEPVNAIKEMKRVVKKGGHIAVRESDYSTMQSFPKFKGIELWRKIYRKTCYKNQAEPDAGIMLKQWFLSAGFELPDITFSLSTKLYDENVNKEEKKEWGRASAERMRSSDFGKQALEYGYANEETVEIIANDWLKFSEDSSAIFYYVSGEVVAQKSNK